jgi:beta-galactosidase
MVQAQQVSPRIVRNINAGWLFSKSNATAKDWQGVNLPHTWNAEDVLDDEPGYYRGITWYKKTFTVEKAMRGKKLFLHFEGANQETEVFLNGKKAGHHIGGYTGFVVPITPFLKANGPNELLIKVDNSHNKNIPPLSADFTFYGGIYRDVYLVATRAIHFAPEDGSNGVFITTPTVQKDKANVVVRSAISNGLDSRQALTVMTTIYDKAGKQVAQVRSEQNAGGGASIDVEQTIDNVISPRLWSPESPYLYTVETKILDSKGSLLDMVTNPLGFRWFRFDAARGFFLNGSPYKLVGTSRHQDYKGLGNAVSDELALQDLVMLKKMGGNFLRIAHYPQDPSVMRACDSLGLLASVEIPIVNEITEKDSFYLNSEQMQREMIRQNFNHPSIIIWCYMNEVLLRPSFNGEKERQEKYLLSIRSLAQRLEKLTRREDPSRYTMMANHGNLEQYKKAGLLEIPMIVGWNLYSGWYGGSLEDFPRFLDHFHAAFPQTPVMVTEYGADADPRIRSLQPVRFDKSIEYTLRFHQYYFTEMMKRPYVAAAMIWNLADFGSETRAETMPHVNNKGLLEWDRTPKDPYYYYQAVLSKDPFIKILGSCQSSLGITDTTTATCYHPLQVATNLDSITIRLNGKEMGSFPSVNGLVERKLPLLKGVNTVVAEGRLAGKLFRDRLETEVHLPEACLANNTVNTQLNIMLGTTRYYRDRNGAWWQPDPADQHRSWGSVGGKRFRLENNARLPYGTDKNILGTDDDPIYQTQQTGIRQYRLPARAGIYELTLHFAELVGGKTAALPYNLTGGDRDERPQPRVFNVRVNGKPFLQQFDIAAEHGSARAVVKSTPVIVREGEGVLIEFEALAGEPVLNALQLKRLVENETK